MPEAEATKTLTSRSRCGWALGSWSAQAGEPGRPQALTEEPLPAAIMMLETGQPKAPERTGQPE